MPYLVIVAIDTITKSWRVINKTFTSVPTDNPITYGNIIDRPIVSVKKKIGIVNIISTTGYTGKGTLVEI